MGRSKRTNELVGKVLVGLTVTVGGALLVWAVAVPALHRGESRRLLTEARELLSPPIKGVTDLDAVECHRAEVLLQHAVQLAPSLGAARRELRLAQGCAALLRGDLVLAESSLQAARRELPRDARVHRWLGALALARGEAIEAERHFREGLRLEPDDVPCRVGLSDALAEQGRHADALAALDEVSGPRLAVIELRRGMLLDALGRLSESREAYERAIELAPDRPEAYNDLAALERDMGQIEQAWRHQQQALERAPDDPLINLNTGLLAIERGDDAQALRCLRRAMELDEQSPDAGRALGDHLLVLGRAEEALEVLGSVVVRFPRDAAVLNSLGNALAAVGRLEEARRRYLQAIERDPTLPQPHNGLAAIMLASDDLAGAERHIQEALRLSPSDREARRNLAELRRRQQELASSESHDLLARAPSTR